LAIAALLHEAGINREFPERAIEAIEIANAQGRLRPRESEVTLRSGGRLLNWGRSPRALGSRPLSAAEILRNLRLVLSDPGTLEYREISLYTPRLVGIRG
jgi:hypothetical protein